MKIDEIDKFHSLRIDNWFFTANLRVKNCPRELKFSYWHQRFSKYVPYVVEHRAKTFSRTRVNHVNLIQDLISELQIIHINWDFKGLDFSSCGVGDIQWFFSRLLLIEFPFTQSRQNCYFNQKKSRMWPVRWRLRVWNS